VLGYAQDGLGTQLLAVVIALLILAYGVLQIALGLAAGMMFVLFPVAAIFAFYLPLEHFPAGVIRNYIAIFLKSVVLLTLAGVVIRLFSIATGSLAAMAAVALVDLLLCLVMAKEALSSLLSNVSFVGQSVGSLGAAIELSGGGGGGMLPSPESRLAASMIGGGAVTQTLMGAPHPYAGAQGATLLGAGGAVLGAPANTARAALGAALAAGAGGAGAIVGAVAAARGADYGSLALMGNAASTILGRNAGRGFMTGAGLSATRQALTKEDRVDSAAEAPGSPPAPPARSSLLVPTAPSALGSATATPAATAAAPAARGSSTLLPADRRTGLPVSAAPLQSLLLGDPDTDFSDWTPASAEQIRRAAGKLEPASPDVEDAAFGLARAGHRQAQQWQHDGRSPVLADGSLDPRLVEEVVQREPDAAATLVAEQRAANVPLARRLSVGEAVALGVTTQHPDPDALYEIPRPPRRPAPRSARPASVSEQAGYDPALFEQLRAWRLGAAEQAGQKAFYVFPDATLKRIAATRPQTVEELGAVKGVGPAKLREYGQAVLDITRQGADEQGIMEQGAKEQEA
jgi:hypothetical protein